MLHADQKFQIKDTSEDHFARDRNEQKINIQSSYGELRVFSGTQCTQLTEEICKHLGISPNKMSVTKFADGETNIQVVDGVRGKDVFIIQSMGSPTNDSVMELLLTISAMRNSSAKRITAIIPYYGY